MTLRQVVGKRVAIKCETVKEFMILVDKAVEKKYMTDQKRKMILTNKDSSELCFTYSNGCMYSDEKTFKQANYDIIKFEKFIYWEG